MAGELDLEVASDEDVINEAKLLIQEAEAAGDDREIYITSIISRLLKILDR